MSPDKEDSTQRKKHCGKISPGPSSFDTTKVNSTFERGESSRTKNLMMDFNSVEDKENIDSDTTCGGL